jgi:hypothetical protein
VACCWNWCRKRLPEFNRVEVFNITGRQNSGRDSSEKTTMYNKQFLTIAGNEIESQIRAMPELFDSREFYQGFAQNHPVKYEYLISLYVARDHDRPHAIQIVNSQLMHTVNDRFHHLVLKVGTVANPKGGDMSEWTRS